MISAKRSRISRTPVRTLRKLEDKSSVSTQPETPSANEETKAVDVQVSKGIQVNWGTLNLPTIISVAGLLWYTATHTERQDARIDSIEDSRKQNAAVYSVKIDNLEKEVAKLSNLEYRMTASETTIDKNNESVNARIDRFSNALQDIRDGIGKLNTNYELLSQKWDQSFPLKKSDLDGIPPPLPHK